MRCAFCDIVAIQNRWNEHSPEYVVNEIEHCVKEYGAREVAFVDDNFMLHKEWVVRICELIVQRRLNIALDVFSGTAIWTLSPAIIDLLVEAGLYRVMLPIESGNPETLRFIKKPVDLDKAVERIEYCNRKGLHTHANLIIGFPYETKEDIQRTFDWAWNSGLDAVNFYVAEPFEGARMFPIYRDNGWLTYKNGYKHSWRTAHFTREELTSMALHATREYLRHRLRFYFKPNSIRRYLLPKFSSTRKAQYAAKVAAYAVFNGVQLSHDVGSISLLHKARSWLGWSRPEVPKNGASHEAVRRPLDRESLVLVGSEKDTRGSL